MANNEKERTGLRAVEEPPMNYDTQWTACRLYTRAHLRNLSIQCWIIVWPSFCGRRAPIFSLGEIKKLLCKTAVRISLLRAAATRPQIARHCSKKDCLQFLIFNRWMECGSSTGCFIIALLVRLISIEAWLIAQARPVCMLGFKG